MLRTVKDRWLAMIELDDRSLQIWPTEPASRWRDNLRARLSRDSLAGSKARGCRIAAPNAGSISRGRMLTKGVCTYMGQEVAFTRREFWKLPQAGAGFQSYLHSFDWLDDLAALGSKTAVTMAQVLAGEWITAFGSGAGPGWYPSNAGRRAAGLATHGDMILADQGQGRKAEHYASLARHRSFLQAAWRTGQPGIHRIQALTGLFHAEIRLDGFSDSARRAAERLIAYCNSYIDPDGSIPSRNPEELLRIAMALHRVQRAICERGHSPDIELAQAINRTIPVLRALRHQGGMLARFHGGSGAPDGFLDAFLADAEDRHIPRAKAAMGFARLRLGYTSVIVDAAPPPVATGHLDGHASTSAFEMYSGDIPVVVNQGPAGNFAVDRRENTRRTAAHSTVEIDGGSSSRFASTFRLMGWSGRQIVLPPDKVDVRQGTDGNVHQLVVAHNGYTPVYGLTHWRRLRLWRGGGLLEGEDTVGPETKEDRRQLEGVSRRSRQRPLSCRARFFLHPDSRVDIVDDEHTADIVLPDGELWRLSHGGKAQLALGHDTYMDETRSSALTCSVIDLNFLVRVDGSRVKWTLAKLT